ncbi:MAG: hypothetical protein WC506_06240 [Candidatus Micrarchaeia archaeon]
MDQNNPQTSAPKPEKPGLKQTLYSMAQDAYKTNAFLILAAVSFALFLITKMPVFGFFVALGIVGAVVVETAVGVKQGGWKNELKEIGIAIAIALIVWYGAGFVLGTPSPVNAIVSCSMLPQLQRGDMVVLQGASPAAPVLDIPAQQAQALYSDPTVHYPNGTLVVKGSIYSYCTSIAHHSDPICDGFKASPESFYETRGNFTFRYAKCPRTFDNDPKQYVEPCVDSVIYNGTQYGTDLENDVIVYATKPGELYAYTTGGGDIIHRDILTVRTPQDTIYLTKGDNNAIFDLQAYYYDNLVPKLQNTGNTPASQAQFKGKVIARVPYLGYPKLFISLFFEEPQGCNMIFTKYVKSR